MVKTNSMQARKGIREYILDHYNPDGYDEYAPTASLKQIAANVLSCFYAEKVEHDKRKMIFEDLFLEWMAGLPNILSADYFLASARDMLGEILDETTEERERFTETQAEELMTKLIYRELLKLAPMYPFC